MIEEPFITWLKEFIALYQEDYVQTDQQQQPILYFDYSIKRRSGELHGDEKGIMHFVVEVAKLILEPADTAEKTFDLKPFFAEEKFKFVVRKNEHLY